MNPKELYIKVMHNGEESTFPVGKKAAILTDWTYTADRMGGAPIIEGKVRHTLCLDSLWTMNEYVEFEGSKYYISHIPSSEKNSDDIRFEHSLTLIGSRVVLENVYMLDVVASTTEDQYKDRFRSNSTSITFFGDIEEMVARINDSLSYSKLYDKTGTSGFCVVIDEGVKTEAKMISMDNVHIADAIQSIFTEFEIPYYWVGNICHVGSGDEEIEEPFSYGQGNGLTAVKKDNDNVLLVNRISFKGGSENIPYYYPNETPTGTTLFAVANMDKENVKIGDISGIYAYLSDPYGKEMTLCKYINTVKDAVIRCKATRMFYNPMSAKGDTYRIDLGVDNPPGKENTRSESVLFTFRSDDGNYIKRVVIDYGCVYWFNAGVPTKIATTFKPSTNNEGITCEIIQSESRTYIREYRGDTEDDWSIDDDRDGITPYIYGMSMEKEGWYLVLYRYAVDISIDTSEKTPEGRLLASINTNATISIDEERYFLTTPSSDKKIPLTSSGMSFSSIPESGYLYYIIVTDNEYYGKLKEQILDVNTSTAIRVTYLSREWIEPSQNLMPPIYRESKGSERFYNAVDNTYTDEDGNVYSFKNPYSPNHPREYILEVDEHPTIEGMKNASGLPIDVIEAVAYDDDDNDDTDEEGNYLHPYFYVRLRQFDGENGFNLFAQGLENGAMTLDFTSGNCSGCSFEIAVSEDKKLVDGKYVFVNPVQTDESGNLVAGDYKDKTSGTNIIASQQDTSAASVWIALKKDTDTFGVIMPNRYGNHLAQAGDTFHIVNILLPSAYIRAAEQRAMYKSIAYMKENNTDKFSFSVTLSRIYLKRHAAIASMLSERSIMRISYDNAIIPLYVTSYSCKHDGEILNEISVTLESSINVANSQIDNRISEATGALGSSLVGMVDNKLSGIYESINSILSQIRTRLSREEDDTAEGRITFKKGFGLPGNRFYIDESGNGVLNSLRLASSLEVPELRKNKTVVYTGLVMYTDGAIVERVEIAQDGSGVGVMYLKLEQGDFGTLQEGDLCQGIWHDYDGNSEITDDDRKGNFSFAGFKTVYLLVTGVSGDSNEIVNYILRSENEGGNGFHPFVGMNLAQRGNISNPKRQSVEYYNPYEGYHLSLANVNKWEFEPSNIIRIEDNIEGFQMEAIDKDGNTYMKTFHGHGNVFGEAYIFGKIDQFERIAYRMEIEQELAGTLAPGETEGVACTILDGYGQDVTARFTRWKLTRNTGDAASDGVWDASHTDVGNPFQIGFDDLGIDGIDRHVAVFTVTATDEEEESVVAQMTFNS